MKKKTGPTCPKCGAAIRATAAVCVGCGLNFQTGEQAEAAEVRATTKEFTNPFLQEAAAFMQRDIVSGERHNKSGMPWWMLMSFLVGAVCIMLAGVIIVDANFNEKAPEDTFLGRLQRQHIGVVMGVTFAAVGIVISNFAHWSIVIFAFYQSAGKGFATMLIPLYAFIYGCMTWADNKSGIIGLLVGAVLAGAGIALAISCGGIH